MSLQKIVEGASHYVVDTTAVLTTSTPIYATMEVFASGMSTDTSINSRISIAKLGYLGLGWLYAKGRDISRRLFKVADNSSEKVQTLHDSLYAASFNIAVSIPVYLHAGADTRQIITGTIAASVLALAIGPISGYSIDTFRDLTGLKESKRIPGILGRMRRRTKKLVAAGLIGASLALTSGVYVLKDYISRPVAEQIQYSSLEQKALQP